MEHGEKFLGTRGVTFLSPQKSLLSSKELSGEKMQRRAELHGPGDTVDPVEYSTLSQKRIPWVPHLSPVTLQAKTEGDVSPVQGWGKREGEPILIFSQK